jgi:rSAM/selenodomain-associated transferase 1
LQAALLTSVVALAVDAGYATTVVVTPPHACDGVAAAVRPAARVAPQRGVSLGDRMLAAVDDALAAGAGCVVVVGTDAPTLDERTLAVAFAALGDADVVLGPAEDGGYYLVGLRARQPALFALDPALWGGPDVLAATLDAARHAGLAVRLLDVQRDLDRPDDALALRDDPRVPVAVRSVLHPAAVAR